jgi:hypothetical protein
MAYVVKFDNGMSVSFDSEPTQDDINEAEKALGIGASKPAAPGKEKGLDLPYLAQEMLNSLLKMPSWMDNAQSLKEKPLDPRAVTAKEHNAKVEKMVGNSKTPATKAEQYLGAGARAVADPFSYIIPAGGPVTSVATAALGGTGAEAGADIGETVGKAFNAPTAGRIAGGLFGGIGGSLVAGMPSNYKGVYNEVMGRSKALKEAAEGMGGKRAISLAQSAAKDDPRLLDNLARAKEIEQLTGVKLPVVAASGGNPVIDKAVRSQVATDIGGFTAKIKQQEIDAQNQITKRAGQLFGQGDAEQRVLTAVDNSQTVKRAPLAVAARIEEIDKELSKLSSKIVDIDKNDLGNRVASLVEQKEKLARVAVTKEFYEPALKLAKDNGYQMDAKAVAPLHQFVTDTMNSNIFQKEFPSLYRTAMKALAPEKATKEALRRKKDGIGFEKVLLNEGSSYKPLDIDAVDSLKRALNAAKPVNREQAMFLREFKETFDQSLSTMPEDFVSLYKAGDAAYRTKVGIPFGAKAIEDIGAKGFVEQTVPTLTMNKSALSQFMDVSGKEGIPLAKDAFMYEVSKIANIIDPNTGNINVKQLNRYIDKKGEQLALVPGLKEELQGLTKDTSKLLATEARLLGNLKEEQVRFADSLFQKVSKQGLDGTISSYLTSPQTRQGIFKQLDSNPEAMKGFRAALLDKALQSGEPMKFFKDNEAAIGSLFRNKQYVKNMEALIEASDRLRKTELKSSPNVRITEMTQLEQAANIPATQVFSVARDRIMSVPQKVAILTSKYFQGTANKAESAAIQEFLSDPDNLRTAAMLMEKAGSPTLSVEGAKNVSKALVSRFKDHTLLRMAVGTNLAVQGEAEDE